jgi:osmotically-inducible protein OsmY
MHFCCPSAVIQNQQTGDEQMSRNYQRDDRDWRRQQQEPSRQEDDRWSENRTDDDFSMGLGQESRGDMQGRSRQGGYRQQGQGNRDRQRFENSYQGQDRDLGANNYRAAESGWDQANEGFQEQPSRWQRSQNRIGGQYVQGSAYNRGEQGNWGQQGSSGQQGGWRQQGNWGGNESYDGSAQPQRGWREGVDDAMHRGEGQFSGRGPRNYKRSDDRIEEDVNERLTRHGNIDASEIEVTVQNGEVTLKGTVDTRQAKRLAEDIAENVSGVKEVNNQIKMRQQGEQREGKQENEQSGGKQRKAS